MFNFIKNMKIRTAVIAVAILPLMSSFIYSAHSVYSDLQTVSELESLGRLTKLTIKMNELVHEVQLERGVSSIYLGSKGKTFAKELLEERKATNTKRTEFIDLIKRSDIKEYGDQFSGGIDSLIKDLTRLDSIRERVDHFTISIPEEVEYFSSLNALTNDPSTILIDFRNHYESEVGHFKDAILPDVDTFRESLPYIEEEYLKGNEDKNLVMYCTGGIRCEKASAWFRHRGFKNVHQLEGGIIKYANDCKEKGIENKFIGKNFVFDERRGERISDDVISVCHQCGSPADTHTNCANDACHLLFIQCDSCKEKMTNCCSSDCQEMHQLPEEQQKELRKGIMASNKIFKKGRSEKLPFQTNTEKPVSLIESNKQ